MTVEALFQLWLAFFSVFSLISLASAFAAMDDRRELHAWILTSVAQAFWLAATWRASQWGMFLVCVIYEAIALYSIFRLSRRLLRRRRW